MILFVIDWRISDAEEGEVQHTPGAWIYPQF